MTAVAWVFGLFGLVSLLLAVSRLAAARRLAATGHAVLAALLLGAAVVTGVLAADLASYQPREGDRPIAFHWQLQHRLPADLYTAFAAVAA